MARHLHQQAGGEPSQGPVRDMANPSPSPAAGNDFPDAPDGDDDAERGGLSSEQLDDMAARMGLTESSDDETETSDDETASRPDATRRRSVIGWGSAGLAGGAVTGLIVLVRVRRRRRLLSPRF